MKPCNEILYLKYFFFFVKVTQQTQPQLVLAGPQPSPTTATMIPTQGLLLNQVIIMQYISFLHLDYISSACSLYNYIKIYIHQVILIRYFDTLDIYYLKNCLHAFLLSQRIALCFIYLSHFKCRYYHQPDL